MRVEFLFAGTGEQGIQLMGRVFKQTLHREGYDVARNENYGPEARGGKSFCEVVIKECPEDWPGIFEADFLAVLSQQGYDSLGGRIKNAGVIIYDSDLVKVRKKKNCKAFPMAETSLRIGGMLNMVLLGLIVALTELTTIEAVCRELDKEGKLSDINRRSLEEGYKLAKN